MADLKKQLQDMEDKHKKEIQELKELILKEDNPFQIGTHHFYDNKVLYKIIGYHDHGTKPILLSCESGKEFKYDYTVSEMKGSTFKWTAASINEIQDYLVKQAKSKGYEKGITIKSLYFSNEKRLLKDQLKLIYHPNIDSLDWGCDCTIFKNGKWAEIVGKKEIIKIGEFEAEWINHYTTLKVGCNEIPASHVVDLGELMERLGIESVKMSHAGEVVTLDIINKLLSLRNK